LKMCTQRNLQLIKEHQYTLFQWDIERTIYIVKKW
jgi:hypothetical protein